MKKGPVTGVFNMTNILDFHSRNVTKTVDIDKGL